MKCSSDWGKEAGKRGKFPWSNEMGQNWVYHLLGVLLSRQNFLGLKNIISLLLSMNTESLLQNTSKHHK